MSTAIIATAFKPPRKREMTELTELQQRFVVEYAKDGNATQAAIRAGYSKRTAQRIGSENLYKPLVRAAVDAARARYLETAGIETVDLLLEAKAIAFSNLADAFDPVTGALLPVHRMPEGIQKALASIKVQELQGGMEITADGGPQHVPMFTKEVKVWDKLNAIFKLLDYRRGLPTASDQPKGNTYVQININQALADLRALRASVPTAT